MRNNFVLVLLASYISNVQSGNNGLALTPPLSWRSWNAFGWQISEETIRTAANGLVDTTRPIKGRPVGTSLKDPCDYCMYCLVVLNIFEFIVPFNY
jgi:hypothetical protein